MSTIYRIKDWESLYETAETRKLENLRWAAIPNKHDGLGFRRVAQQRNRTELFAAWVLLVQVASKGRRGQRGVLARDGRPLDAEDLSLMTGFPAPMFKEALSFFSDAKQGWLLSERHGDASAKPASASEQSDGSPGSPASSPERPADSPGSPASSPAEGKEGKEGKVEKGKEAGRPAAPGGPADDGGDSEIVPILLNTPEFLAAWAKWRTLRRKGKKPATPWADFFAAQLEWLGKLGPTDAVESIENSIRNGWQGLFEPKRNGSAGQQRPNTGAKSTFEQERTAHGYTV